MRIPENGCGGYFVMAAVARCRAAGREGRQSKIPLLSGVKQRIRIRPYLHGVLVNARALSTLLPWRCSLQGQVNTNHRHALAPIGEAEAQNRLDEPGVRRQLAFGIATGRGHCLSGHRAQPGGHLTGLVGQQTWISERPTALGSRHLSTDDQPVVVVRVSRGGGELVAQGPELDAAHMITQKHDRRMSHPAR